MTIAIIALLLAMLLPALARAREQSRRTVCAANLYDLYLTSTFYAHDSENRFILGYWSQRQFNYAVYVGTSGDYDNSYYHPELLVLWGRYYFSGLVNKPNSFFCPGNHDPLMQLDVKDNPWPPGTKDSTKNTRASYGTRPEVGMDWFNKLGAVNGMPKPEKWPKIDEYLRKAVAADIVSAPSRVDQVHNEGVNVGYGDGSAAWVGRKVFNANLKLAPEAFNASADNLMLNATNQTGVWYDLDRAK